MAFPSPSEGPRRATKGSAGLDLYSTTRLILTPQMGVQPMDTDFKGPLPEDTVGLLLGRSSSALKGLQIVPGVIDPYYTGIVKFWWPPPRVFLPFPLGTELLNYSFCLACINISLLKIKSEETRVSCSQVPDLLFSL